MMKNLVVSFFTLVLLISCGGTSENTMTVSGNVKGLKKGTLYLQHVPDSTLVILDSLQVDGDGNFNFSTELESPELFYLYLSKKDNNDINDRITFFGEPGNITINTAWNTFDTQAKIEGSETQKKYEEYLNTMSNFNKRSLGYMQTASDATQKFTAEEIDSIQKLSEKNVVRGYLYAINFAINNADSYVAPYIAVNEISDANIKYLDSIASKLSPEVAASKYGIALKEHIDTRKK